MFGMLLSMRVHWVHRSLGTLLLMKDILDTWDALALRGESGV